MNFDKLQIVKGAFHLSRLTIGDLTDALRNETDLEVLQHAIYLFEAGSGYGSGKTAIKMIESRMRKLEKGLAK